MSFFDMPYLCLLKAIGRRSVLHLSELLNFCTPELLNLIPYTTPPRDSPLLHAMSEPVR